jgi:HEAT repeat protein
LTRALSDAAPSVRIVAAEALAYFGDRADLEAALPVLVEHADQSKHGPYLAMLALNALDYLDAKAKPVEAKIAALPEQSGSVDQRIRANPGNLIRKTLADLRPR